MFIVLLLTILFQTNELACHYTPPFPSTGPPFFETVTHSVPRRIWKGRVIYKRTEMKSGLSVAHFHCGVHGSGELMAEHGGRCEASVGSISRGFLRFSCHPGGWQMIFLTFLELLLRWLKIKNWWAINGLYYLFLTCWAVQIFQNNLKLNLWCGFCVKPNTVTFS